VPLTRTQLPTPRASGSGLPDLGAELACGGDALSVRYQPQVELVTGRVTAVEAVPCWQHPEHGELALGDLTGVEPALLAAAGEQLLARAVGQVVAWRALPGRSDLQLSLGLSDVELRRPERLLSVLHGAGLPAHALVVGVLEDVVSHKGAVAALEAFVSAGVQLALDRFGTGAASLHHLRALPVSVLRVDASFVAGLGSNPRDEAIVRALTALTADLGARCLADGVAVDRQLAWLVDNEVPLGQGPLLHRSRSAPDLTALLREVG
jgi:EAL domain-containing protein (putative c-di-GMP-specific phosphodiesterase class I)